MPDLTEKGVGPDWGSIEQGNAQETTSALWLTYNRQQQQQAQIQDLIDRLPRDPSNVWGQNLWGD